MRRTGRVVLTAAALAGCAAAVLGLTALGTRTEGPLTGALERAAGMVGVVEGRVARRVHGPGREAHLAWFAPMRTAARLRRPEGVLLGAYDQGLPASLQGVLDLEGRLGTALPLVALYTAWGDRPEQQFPRRQLQAVWDLGSVPVVTWEPWLTDFENRLHPSLPLRAERDRGGLAAIARGEYDFYVDAWARDAARWGRPVLVRWGHEMNDPYRYPWGPQNNAPADYVAAWRHVVERFRRAGAANVLWVWSPHVAYAGSAGYYPGGDVVDWVATGALNYGTVAYWSRWWSFQEIYGSKRGVLTPYGKPVMLAEFGSLAVGGDRAAWYREALAGLPARYPEIRAVVLYGASRDATVTQQVLDWSLAPDSASLHAVAGELGRWAPGISRASAKR
ncbi:MAG: glycosyl hydrolase [Longimicrobiaceae bacterium]